ncbi:MAG: helix-turn-helix transcriptional regulator, partial [Lachnospiraceae bacterium]|nr:helix-turn-helix transcriptional regulator [Lachnospiraceae bacterium]
MGDKREEEIITFGTFLKSCRVEKGVSQEKLARGLMSKSMLSKIENKGLTPDYLMRNRLMERLGLSAEGCEDFLQASEYARYEKRLKLMTAIEARQTHHAREILEELAETLKGEEKIERQFLLDMEGRIRRQEKRPGDEIFAVYDEAVNLTIPSVSCGFADCVFAPEEYYLLICRADYMDSPNDEEELENILKSIQACKLWKFAKAKILPLAAIKYAQIILRNNPTTEELELALAYVNEAVETLRETSRMYCLMDLLNVRGDLLCNLVDHYPMLKIEEEENQHFQNAFLYLYENYGSGIKPEDDCYIYRSPEIHSVADVVLSRRKALGVTRKMLTNICDEKT